METTNPNVYVITKKGPVSLTTTPPTRSRLLTMFRPRQANTIEDTKAVTRKPRRRRSFSRRKKRKERSVDIQICNVTPSVEVVDLHIYKNNLFHIHKPTSQRERRRGNIHTSQHVDVAIKKDIRTSQHVDVAIKKDDSLHIYRPTKPQIHQPTKQTERKGVKIFTSTRKVEVILLPVDSLDVETRQEVSHGQGRGSKMEREDVPQRHENLHRKTSQAIVRDGQDSQKKTKASQAIVRDGQDSQKKTGIVKNKNDSGSNNNVVPNHLSESSEYPPQDKMKEKASESKEEREEVDDIVKSGDDCEPELVSACANKCPDKSEIPETALTVDKIAQGEEIETDDSGTIRKGQVDSDSLVKNERASEPERVTRYIPPDYEEMSTISIIDEDSTREKKGSLDDDSTREKKGSLDDDSTEEKKGNLDDRKHEKLVGILKNWNQSQIESFVEGRNDQYIYGSGGFGENGELESNDDDSLASQESEDIEAKVFPTSSRLERIDEEDHSLKTETTEDVDSEADSKSSEEGSVSENVLQSEENSNSEDLFSEHVLQSEENSHSEDLFKSDAYYVSEADFEAEPDSQMEPALISLDILIEETSPPDDDDSYCSQLEELIHSEYLLKSDGYYVFETEGDSQTEQDSISQTEQDSISQKEQDSFSQKEQDSMTVDHVMDQTSPPEGNESNSKSTVADDGDFMV